MSTEYDKDDLLIESLKQRKVCRWKDVFMCILLAISHWIAFTIGFSMNCSSSKHSNDLTANQAKIRMAINDSSKILINAQVSDNGDSEINIVRETHNNPFCEEILSQFESSSNQELVKPNEKMNFFSQSRQDWFLYSAIFQNMQKLNKKGYYIDLAANHYRMHSNTYFLDECLNWNGICIEAQSIYWKDIMEHRSCKLNAVCIYSEEKLMHFTGVGGEAGLDILIKKEKNGKTNNGNLIKCETLQNVIEMRGIYHIDYMSLDIEKAEFEALKGVNWNKTQIDVMTIEHPEYKPGFDDYLKTIGFVPKFSIHGLDVVYVHKNAKQKMEWIDNWLYTAPWREGIPCDRYNTCCKQL